MAYSKIVFVLMFAFSSLVVSAQDIKGIIAGDSISEKKDISQRELEDIYLKSFLSSKADPILTAKIIVIGLFQDRKREELSAFISRCDHSFAEVVLNDNPSSIIDILSQYLNNALDQVVGPQYEFLRGPLQETLVEVSNIRFRVNIADREIFRSNSANIYYEKELSGFYKLKIGQVVDSASSNKNLRSHLDVLLHERYNMGLNELSNNILQLRNMSAALEALINNIADINEQKIELCFKAYFDSLSSSRKKVINILSAVNTATNNGTISQSIRAQHTSSLNDLKTITEQLNTGISFVANVAELQQLIPTKLPNFELSAFIEGSLTSHIQGFASSFVSNDLLSLSSTLFTGNIVGLFNLALPLFGSSSDNAIILQSLNGIKNDIKQLRDEMAHWFTSMDTKLSMIHDAVVNGFERMEAHSRNVLNEVLILRSEMAFLHETVTRHGENNRRYHQDQALADLKGQINQSLQYFDIYRKELPQLQFNKAVSDFQLYASDRSKEQVFAGVDVPLQRLEELSVPLTRSIHGNLNYLMGIPSVYFNIRDLNGPVLGNTFVWLLAAEAYAQICLENISKFRNYDLKSQKLQSVIQTGVDMLNFANKVRYRDSLSITVPNRRLFEALFNLHKKNIDSLEAIVQREYSAFLAQPNTVTDDEHKKRFVSEVDLFSGALKKVNYTVKNNKFLPLSDLPSGQLISKKFSNVYQYAELLGLGENRMSFVDVSWINGYSFECRRRDPNWRAQFCKVDATLSARYRYSFLNNDGAIQLERIMNYTGNVYRIADWWPIRAAIPNPLDFRVNEVRWEWARPDVVLTRDWSMLENSVVSDNLPDSSEVDLYLLKEIRSRLASLGISFLDQLRSRAESPSTALGMAVRRLSASAALINGYSELAFETNFLKSDLVFSAFATLVDNKTFLRWANPRQVAMNLESQTRLESHQEQILRIFLDNAVITPEVYSKRLSGMYFASMSQPLIEKFPFDESIRRLDELKFLVLAALKDKSIDLGLQEVSAQVSALYRLRSLKSN